MAYLIAFTLLSALVIISGFYYYTGYLERTFNLTLKNKANTQFISDKQWHFWELLFYIVVVILISMLAIQIITWTPFYSFYHVMNIA